MKILKKILIGFITVIALLLIIAAFLPKTFTAKSEIVINKPKQEVYDYVKYVKNQDNYGKWQLSDPTMKKTYEGEDGTVGFKYTWDSEVLGKGSQKVIGLADGEKIETELDFGMGEPATSFIITENAGNNQTKVIWGITGKSPWPWNLMSLFYDMSKDFDEGLSNLKRVLEK